MALVVITRKAYGDEPGTDYPNLAGKAKKSAANTALKGRGFSRAAKRSCKIGGFWPPGTTCGIPASILQRISHFVGALLLHAAICARLPERLDFP
jgi:hypothetical protein